MNLVLRTLVVLKPALQDTKIRKLILANIGIVLLAIAGIFGIVHWRHGFMDAVSNKDVTGFTYSLVTFALLAGGIVITRGFQSFIAKLIEYRSREILFDHYVERIIEGSTPNNIEALEQRITLDTALIPRIAGSVVFGLLEALVSMVVFGIMTWLIAPMYTLPVLILYVGIGIYYAKKIGRPLTDLDYIQQNKESQLYREVLAWLPSKAATTAPKMRLVKENFITIAKRIKMLAFFSSSHGQLANILPIVLLSPLYFKGALTLGGLWSASDAAGKLVDALSYIIERRADINELTSCIKRLEELS